MEGGAPGEGGDRMKYGRTWPPSQATPEGQAPTIDYGDENAAIAVHLDVLRQQAEAAGYTLIEALDMATAALGVITREE